MVSEQPAGRCQSFHLHEGPWRLGYPSPGTAVANLFSSEVPYPSQCPHLNQEDHSTYNVQGHHNQQQPQGVHRRKHMPHMEALEYGNQVAKGKDSWDAKSAIVKSSQPVMAPFWEQDFGGLKILEGLSLEEQKVEAWEFSDHIDIHDAAALQQ